MKVKKKHIETGESGETSSCTTFHFRKSKQKMFGRIWDDDQQTADLIHWTDEEKKFHKFTNIPYDHDLFRSAVRHYVDKENVKHVIVLLFPHGEKRPEMQRVDLRKIPKQKK